MHAIRMHDVGGPDVLRYEEAPEPSLQPGHAMVELQAVGVNFTDVYTRSGLVRPPEFPWIPGVEGAGVVSALGDGVTEAAVGDLVAFTSVPGSYAQRVAVPAHRLVKLPAGMDAEAAASSMLQGMTAHYLCRSISPVKAGMSVLVHAGAGGVGLLLVQMVKQLGGYVFATVSTEEKATLAKKAGADRTINYTQEDFQEEVSRATDGQGVAVVYDSVGKTTFHQSLACLSPRGYLILYGQSSGHVEPVAPYLLNSGSLFLTRPTLVNYIATREELLQRTEELFGWIQRGELKLHIGGRFPLSEAAEAHRQLEGRRTTGKLLLIP